MDQCTHEVRAEYWRKIIRLSVIASAANERRCIWRGAKDLTFTY